MIDKVFLYHGSTQQVEYPEIRREKYNKDFYWGFYCTLLENQAVRWASRFKRSGVINTYSYIENPKLRILKFPEMNDAWLDFIVACRSGKSHDYDIVEGAMADDTIFTYVQDFIDGNISRAAFWELARFKYPTHQVSFHTAKALDTLTFERSDTCNVPTK